jgi:colicin import membrane protein
MRAGFTASVVLHAGVLLFALAGISMSKPFEPTPEESIAVDLVPASDVANIRVGSLDSTVVQTETPAAVQADKPAEIAQPAGNTEEDQPTPNDSPTPSPAPTNQTAPATPTPPPQPDPTPQQVAPDPAPQPEPPPTPQVRQIEPTPAPQPPQPAPAPEDTAPPPPLATPDVTEDPAAAAPQPVIKTASLEQKRAEYKQQVAAQQKAEADAKAKADADAKAKAAADAAAKKAADLKKQQQQQQADEQPKPVDLMPKPDTQAKPADQVADLINSENSRGAITGNGGQPTLGRQDGRSASLSQTEMDALAAAMKQCFSPPPGAAEENASAIIQVSLLPDGRVQGQPQILSVAGPTMGAATGKAAVRAVLRCGQNGYTMLPPDKYAGDLGWNTVKVTFNANETF